MQKLSFINLFALFLGQTPSPGPPCGSICASFRLSWSFWGPLRSTSPRRLSAQGCLSHWGLLWRPKPAWRFHTQRGRSLWGIPCVDRDSGECSWYLRTRWISPEYHLPEPPRGSMWQRESTPRQLESKIIFNFYPKPPDAFQKLTSLWSRIQFIIILYPDALVIVNRLPGRALIAKSTSFPLPSLLL